MTYDNQRNFDPSGIVVDVRKQSNFGDSNYQVTVKDLKDWEKKNGQIPKGAIMLLFTGNGEHYRNPQRYYGYKSKGELESRSTKLLTFPGKTSIVVIVTVL